MMKTLLTAASITFTDPRVTPKRSARRCLFGKAGDSDGDFIKRLNEEMAEEYKAKWGFDFVNGVPLPTTSDSKYTYIKIDPASVPRFYKCSTYTAKITASHGSNSENKDPEKPDSSMETDDSFLLPTTDESDLSDFFNGSQEEIALKSARKVPATPRKMQTRINGKNFVENFAVVSNSSNIESHLINNFQISCPLGNIYNAVPRNPTSYLLQCVIHLVVSANVRLSNILF